jgi:uncharacterized protein YvpB
MPKKRWLIIISIFSALTLISYALLLNPTFQESLGWRLNQWVGAIRVWINPPSRVSFSGDGVVEGSTELPPVSGLADLIDGDLELADSEEDVFSFAPVPLSYSLGGISYFSQHNRWNYCGPANLAMALSYWGWEGDHDEAARGVRTHSKDKNVMPYEMVDFAKEQEGLSALTRVGGDFDLIKRLIAAGFPVVVEKGPHFRDITNQWTWMGHYQTLTGYNDAEGYFTAQDSYIEPDYPQSYDELVSEWRSFNYTYIVIYPDHMENDVLNLLGADADEDRNIRRALKKAQEELYQTTGVDQFFAMYNYGTNLTKLRDYAGAAKAFDQAFAMYDALPQDASIRPHRILWYQTGPYMAYYYTGRYTDVISKAQQNSIEMVRDDVPALEESWYWMGLAKIAIGDKSGGVDDLYTCLEYHREFQPCVDALNGQGEFPYSN